MGSRTRDAGDLNVSYREQVGYYSVYFIEHVIEVVVYVFHLILRSQNEWNLLKIKKNTKTREIDSMS